MINTFNCYSFKNEYLYIIVLSKNKSIKTAFFQYYTNFYYFLDFQWNENIY